MKQGLDNNGITRRSKALYSAVGLPSETVEVQKEARAFAEEYLKPRAFAINSTPESDNSFPRAVFNEMANHGLYEIPFPQDVGGRGLQYPTLAILVITTQPVLLLHSTTPRRYWLAPHSIARLRP